MGSLMAALVAALLIRATDPTATYVARVADRSGKAGAVLAGALVAILITHAIAAVAGFFLAPHLTPNPKRLFVAFALLAAASGGIWPGKAIEPGEGRHPFWTTAGRLTVGGWSGRSEFVTLALAMSGTAALAGIGGFIGSAVVLGFAAIGGDMIWRTLPHRAIGIVLGGLLAVAGFWLAFSALRLI
jgi:putative Ca2+/H+ antiporter (TMEM165/GDT1 family)